MKHPTPDTSNSTGTSHRIVHCGYATRNFCTMCPQQLVSSTFSGIYFHGCCSPLVPIHTLLVTLKSFRNLLTWWLSFLLWVTSHMLGLLCLVHSPLYSLVVAWLCRLQGRTCMDAWLWVLPTVLGKRETRRFKYRMCDSCFWLALGF